MFEWRWTDLARECEEHLGPAGYQAVQTSPPQEHIPGPEWWTRYQPVSYRIESRGGTREEFTVEGLLGVESHWKISDRQALVFTNTLHPNLEDSGEFRNLTTLDWNLQLDETAGFGLKVGLSNEYDSLSEDADSKNDFKYTGALVWDL